jgi:hypothetical protein
MSEVTSVESKESEQITLTIRTVEGEQWTDRFNIHETIGNLVRRSLAHFAIQPPPGVVYHLLYQGRTLDDSKTIEQEGLPNGATLLLATEAQVG